MPEPDSFLLTTTDGSAEVIPSSATEERRRGIYLVYCPWHEEQTPSCVILPAKGQFYCFGSHATGDVECL